MGYFKSGSRGQARGTTVAGLLDPAQAAGRRWQQLIVSLDPADTSRGTTVAGLLDAAEKMLG